MSRRFSRPGEISGGGVIGKIQGDANVGQVEGGGGGKEKRGLNSENNSFKSRAFKDFSSVEKSHFHQITLVLLREEESNCRGRCPSNSGNSTGLVSRGVKMRRLHGRAPN